MEITQSRRTFLAAAAAAGAMSLIGTTRAHAEAPPETSAVRLPVFVDVSDCLSPMYVAEELLRAEGLTDIAFVSSGTGPDSADWLVHGEVDFDWNFPPAYVRLIDKNFPITVLGGMHAGCLELIARDQIRDVLELKGKRVGVDFMTGVPHLLLMIMVSYVGLDPVKDLEWVVSQDPLQELADGKIDGFLGAPPLPQAARERKIGHVILNTSVNRPWAQYFCCMLASNREYARRNPIATKRVLRALLKAVDLCISDAQLVAKRVVAKGFASSYDYALQAMADVRFDKWRDYDPEDSLRFYALRMQEIGIVEVSPKKVIAEGTDWRFLNEIKREMKV